MGMQEVMSIIFAKLFIFLLLSSNCGDGDDQKVDTCVMRSNSCTEGNAHQIQLIFNRSLGKVTPTDFDVTDYETASTVEIYEFTRRTMGTALQALPAKAKATIGNEFSMSYISRHHHHMYETYGIGSLIDDSERLEPATTVYEESDRVTGVSIDVYNEAYAMMQVNTTYAEGLGFTLSIGRPQVVDFTLPYSERGVVMVIKKNREVNQVFSFMSPFTKEMWLTMASMSIFTAFVIWLVECRTAYESGSLRFREVAAIIWFPLATLFFGAHRESPRNSLTYIVLGPWLLLIMLVTATYTASFTSKITSSNTESSFSVIETLKITNAMIGCDEDSITLEYLVDLIGFQRKNIKHIAQSSIDDYAKALSNGTIEAAFFLAPNALDFLAKYSKGFSAQNAICNVVPCDSPFASDCSDRSCSTIDGSIKGGIGPGPFSGLFILSGGASAIAVLITVIPMMKRRWESFVQGMLMGRGLWMWLVTLFSQNQRRNELQLARI